MDAGSHRSDVQTNGSSNKWLKAVCLLLLTPQYAILILTMRYVRTRSGPMFVTSTVILLAEMVKAGVCLLLLLAQEKSVRGWTWLLYDHLLCRPSELAKVCVPSLVFVIQNNLVFVAVSNLDAATFQVTYQLKVLTTAFFSVLILGKRLSRTQWIALFILFVGEAIVQIQPARSVLLQPTNSAPHAADSTIRGLIAVFACCCLSGFASVYIEKILKGGDQSMWLRNVQLGLTGAVIAALAVAISDGSVVKTQGFFYGYDWVVWTVVGLQSFGGLLVAAVIKYADNILKGFSTAGSILLSCVAAVYLFDLNITEEFVIGTSFVIASMYLYILHPPASHETVLTIAKPAAVEPTDSNSNG